MDRRTALGILAAAPAAPVVAACARTEPSPASTEEAALAAQDVVRDVAPLGSPWETLDPFLFCVHHDDAYPAGN
ncbi:MAG TPA: pirin family protein, partial [Sorangium sp.]|nr:pirin family protein [Sorangium sp.]